VTRGPVRDVRHLPEYAFGHRLPIWWGTLGFMVIEATGFVMIVAAYFYLASQNPSWPLATALPRLTAGSALAVYLLLTEIPNFWVKRAAKRLDLRATRIGVVLMTALGLGALAIRAFEFGALECRWDTNASGSVVWGVLFLHTVHIVTDVSETAVMAVLAFLARWTRGVSSI
jgi:cytochrome c oxidase subunit III